MDSGYNWNEPDLLNKWYLNRKELPPPNRTVDSICVVEVC